MIPFSVLTRLPDTLQALGAELGRLRQQAASADQRILFANQRAEDAVQQASVATQRATAAEQERAVMSEAHDRRVSYVFVLQRRIAELERQSWRF